MPGRASSSFAEVYGLTPIGLDWDITKAVLLLQAGAKGTLAAGARNR